MAGTSEGAVKAWLVRARNSGSGDTVQLRSDYGPPRLFRGASEREVARLTETIRGKAWKLDDVADIAGAAPGSTVRIEVVNNHTLSVVTTFPKDAAVSVRDISLYDGVIKNRDFMVKETGLGLGADSLALEVESAVKHGLSRIEVTAAGRPGGADNGYYTWARLGFESVAGPVWGPRGQMSLHKLMQQPGGAEWWKKNGHAFKGVFSLAAGSTSRRMLAEYRRLRASRGGQ